MSDEPSAAPPKPARADRQAQKMRERAQELREIRRERQERKERRRLQKLVQKGLLPGTAQATEDAIVEPLEDSPGSTAP